MWPLRNDMTRDECRKCLRCLELDAYGSMVSVLRAQGPFTNEKQKLLQELAKVLHISNERHRAEVRRAVNDEKLAIIAEQLNGPNTGIDWAIEGRRTIPLLPRLKGRTAFTSLANTLSLATAIANQKQPLSQDTIKNTKGIIDESKEQLTLIDIPSSNTEESHIVNRIENITNQNGDKEMDDGHTNLETLSRCAISEKRKSPSPLPASPPSKVLVVSSNSLRTQSHCLGSESDSCILLPQTNASYQSNLAAISSGTDYVGNNATACEDSASQTSTNKHRKEDTNIIISMDENNAIKNRLKIDQEKVNQKITSVIGLPSSPSQEDGKNLQQLSNIETRIPTTDEISNTVTYISHDSVKILKTDNENANALNIARVTPILNSNVKAIVSTKTLTSGLTHRIKTISPASTASSGPGPPHLRPVTTTVVRTKMPPTALNQQTVSKMAITLSSNKTVNISHHPNAKLTPKTNVIVIQKGSNKGVTLSHAGKEVLGKVIMGGKSLCVSNQQSTSVNILPHRISTNNGDQTVTLSSSTNAAQTNCLKSNVKVSGETVVFNLRREALESKETLSQIHKSSSTLTSDSKSVIQNTSAHLARKEEDGLHIVDTEMPLNTATTVNYVTEERQDR